MQRGPFDADEAPAPAEVATDIGADDDLSLPVLEVIKTFLLVVVCVGTAALIALLV